VHYVETRFERSRTFAAKVQSGADPTTSGFTTTTPEWKKKIVFKTLLGLFIPSVANFTALEL
jgi:hypothetical protein